MASPQYHIPTSPEGSFDPHFLRPQDITPEVTESPEQPGKYSFVKSIEAHIVSHLHANATEAHLPPLSRVDQARERVMNFFATNPVPPSLGDKLTEAERAISRRINSSNPDAPDHGIWFHGGDWFEEVIDATGVTITRYQFTHDAAYKLVDGREVEFPEVQTILDMIRIYHQQIQIELYPDLITHQLNEVQSKDDFGLAA